MLKIGDALQVTGAADNVSVEIDGGRLSLETFSVEGDLRHDSSSVDLSVVAVLAIPGDEDLVIAGTAGSSGLGFYAALPKIMTSITWLEEHLFGKAIELPAFPVDLEDLNLSVATADLEFQGRALQRGFLLSARMRIPSIQNLSCNLTGALSGEGITLEGRVEEDVLVGPEIRVTNPKMSLQLFTASALAMFEVTGAATIRGLETEASVKLQKMSEKWETVLHAQAGLLLSNVSQLTIVWL